MLSISNLFVRGSFWSLVLGLSCGIAAPGLAAETVTIDFGMGSRSIAVDELENFANTGNIPDNFQDIALVLSIGGSNGKSLLQQFQKQLKLPISIDNNDPNSADKLPTLVKSLLPKNFTERQQQEAATLLAQKANGLTIVELLKRVPVKNLTLDNFIDALRVMPGSEGVRSTTNTFDLNSTPGLVANLVLNGSFEEVKLPDNTWTVFPLSPTDPLPHNLGWNLTPGSSLEIQRYVVGSPAAGFQLLELDAGLTQRNSIYQDILTEPNQKYLLKFAFSPRPFTGISDNILQIKWGNQVVDTLSENGMGLLDTVWKYYTYKLPATSNTTRLEFSDLGTPNGSGTYIDDITVEPVPEPTTVLGTLAFGAIVSSWRMKRKQQQKVVNSTVD